MNNKVLSKHDIMTVGELSQTSCEQMLRFVHPDRHELQMGFCFDHVNIGRGGIDLAMVEPHTLAEFKAILSEWQGLRERGGWHALYLENHDQVRDWSITRLTVFSLGVYLDLQTTVQSGASIRPRC